MFIKVSLNSSELLYEQIKNQVISGILKGTLTPGYSLPSIRNLSKELGISIITVKKAYEELESMGYIFTRPVKGSFISPDAYELARALRLKEIKEGFTKILSDCKSIGLEDLDIMELFQRTLNDKIGGRSYE
ncbi:UNVERIFIED_CONTAM: GntR family transcriptional regulator [Acetivibrio alkalicellulosi]